MTKFRQIWQVAALVLAAIGFQNQTFAQCSFTGLDPTYCEGDDAVTLVGDPTGGVFSGPGMVGDVFDPALAGPGVHTIQYEMGGTAGGGTGDIFYLRAIGGEPWGGSPNPDDMTNAFGPGGWTLGEFETADPTIVFAPTTGFVFMDGSSMQATELETFLIANMAAMEAWVFGGGRLFINSAPNEDNGMSFGFGGTELVYAPPGSGTHSWDGTAFDAAYPALLGPLLPTATFMTGTYYGHALVTGVGLTNVMYGDGDEAKVVLAEKCWGTGRVMFGGMTTTNWHDPDPQSQNWRSNLFTYMYDNGCGEPCIVTQDVEVFPNPDVTLTVDEDEICEGEEVTFTAGGADVYSFDVVGVVSDVAYTPLTIGTTTYTVTGTDNTSGCINTASVDVLVHPTPVVTANSDDMEVCFGDAMTLTGGGADTYVWDHGAINGVPFTPGPIGTTTYTVIGTSEFGCTASASITISIIDCEPVEAEFSLDNNICVGDCITLTDESIGTTITTWEWDFGGGVDPDTSDEQNPTVCFNTVGIFDISLTITSLYGQVSTATHSITVNALPVINAEMDTIIDLGTEANLVATSISEGLYRWEPEQPVDCPTCAITTASPNDSTTFRVYFTDENGCKTQDNVLVLVNFIEGVGLPTAFSPNGDGNNDVLYVKGIGLTSVNLVVYNRYGEVVFETDDQRLGWDGTFKGRDENPGVFTWVLHYDFISGKKGMQKGNTTLIR